MKITNLEEIDFNAVDFYRGATMDDDSAGTILFMKDGTEMIAHIPFSLVLQYEETKTLTNFNPSLRGEK